MNATSLTIRITLRGRLSDRIAAGFEGMAPLPRDGGTELVGHVVDQAQLHGLLTRIRDLGLELSSLTVAGTEPAKEARDGSPIDR